MEELGAECSIGLKITEQRILAGGTKWQGEYFEVTLCGNPTIQEKHKHTKMEWVSLLKNEE